MNKVIFGQKSQNLFSVICFFLLCLILSSCKNFLSGSDLLDELEKQIDYTNLPYANVTINASTDFTKQITPTAGLYDEKYKIKDKINLNFLPKNDYQFISWNVNPQNAVSFDDIYSTETTATIQNADTPLTITPDCIIRPTVSFEPENRSDGVPKNTSIVITFSQAMDISQEDLDRIKITSGLENLTYNFQPPVLSEDKKRITFLADRTNLISLASGTKVLMVTIPQDFYYIYQNKNIELQDTITYSYRINSQTSDKAVISIKASELEGTISYSGSKTYYLDDEVKVKFIPDDSTYILQGWKIVDTEGNEISETVLQKEISEDLQTISVKILTGYDKEIQIQPVCTVKGKLTVNFTKADGFGEISPTEKREYNQKDEFNISYTEGNSNYDFLYWTVFDSITQKPTDAVILEEENAPITKVTVIKDTQNITIQPVCVIRPTVTIEPEMRSDGVAKNTPIVITFSKPMNITTEDLTKIKITSGLEDLSVNFEYPPTVSEDKSKITFIADRNQLINLTSGTKLITVTVPQSFHYLYESNQITLKDDFTYSYRINNQTLDKATINVSTVTGGEISYIGRDSYNLDDELTITYTPLPTYNFLGWSITNSDDTEITNKEGILQISDTTKQTLTVKVLSGSDKEIKISPICNPKEKLSVNFITKNGSITPAEPKQYYKGDEFTLTYAEGSSGYAFLYWKVIDTELQQDVTDYVTLNYEKSTTTVTVLKDSGNITFTPECTPRPTVMSRSPEKTAEGAFRDARIEVIFDQPMDENSLYFTSSEIASIPKGFTLLPEGSTSESKNVYGYWKKNNPDTIVFKNIKITDNNSGENCLQYYDAPFFDTPSTLIIPAKSDNAPTAGKVIKTELAGSGFYHTVGTGDQQKQITLSTDCKWIYTVNSNTDVYPPSIPEGYKVNIYTGTEINDTSKPRTVIESEITQDWLKKHDNLKSIYLADNSITVDAYLFDSGSGLTENGGLYLVATRLYDDKYKKVTEKGYQKDFNLTVSGTGGGCTQKVYFKQTGENSFTDNKKELPDGVYQLDFYGKDKNGNTGVVKTYHILLDNTAPDKVVIEKANYFGYDKTVYFSYKTPDIADLMPPTISIFKGDTDETENISISLNEGKIRFSYEPKTGTQYTIKIRTSDIFGHFNNPQEKQIIIDNSTSIKNIDLNKTHIENNSKGTDIEATIYFDFLGPNPNLELFIDGIKKSTITVNDINFTDLTTKVVITVDEDTSFSESDSVIKQKEISIKDGEQILKEDIYFYICKSPSLQSLEINKHYISYYDANNNTKYITATYTGTNLGLGEVKFKIITEKGNIDYVSDAITFTDTEAWGRNENLTFNIPCPKLTDQYYVQIFLNNKQIDGKNLLIYKMPEFEEFIIPSVSNSEAEGNHYVTAKLKGNYFKITGDLDVNTSDFKLSCPTLSEIGDNYTPTINIIDSNNAEIQLPIYEKAGHHSITISYKDKSFISTYEIRDNINWKPGDILMSDGSLFTYEEFENSNFTLPEGKEPMAIICGQSPVTGKKLGLGVKTSSETITWAPSNTSGAKLRFETIEYDDNNETGDIDGSDNWEAICDIDKNAVLNNYPLFKYAQNYGINNVLPSEYLEGWYIPSYREVCIISTNIQKITKCIQEINKNPYFNVSEIFTSSTPSNSYKYDYFIIAKKYPYQDTIKVSVKPQLRSVITTATLFVIRAF